MMVNKDPPVAEEHSVSEKSIDQSTREDIISKEISNGDETLSSSNDTILASNVHNRNLMTATAIEDGLYDPNVHQHMNTRLFFSLAAMSFLWVGSQIPLYLYGSVLPLIYSEIGGANGEFIWMIIGYFIPNAALCPFVGALSDMFGRKVVAAAGQIMLILGPIIVSTAHGMPAAIAGMAISGGGAGLNELIALAGTSELVPIRKRPKYVTAVVATILPFCPAVFWSNLITEASNWRYVGILVGVWNLLGLLLVVVAYKDPARGKPGESKLEILRKVDCIGGLLSIGGATLFLMGMQFGAQDYSWKSAHVLVPLLLGVVLCTAFFFWERYFAPYPMIPAALFSKDKRTMIALLIITFFSGGGYLGVLLFWPPQSYNMYGEGYIANGLRGLPIGIGIVVGGTMGLILVGGLKNHTKNLMIFWCAFMTAFLGAMSVANLHNLPTVLVMITLASVGVGAIILPCSIIAQIIAPTELIGTMTAITLALRYIGGCVAFTAYYNVFNAKFYDLAVKAGFKLAQMGVSYDYDTLVLLLELSGHAQYEQLHELIATSDKVNQKDVAYDIIIDLTQEAFASAYRWPYWISIPFGGICIIAAFFLRNVLKDAHSAI